MPNSREDVLTVFDNLTLLDNRISREFEKRLPQLAELAALMAEQWQSGGANDPLAFFHRISSFWPSSALHTPHLPKNEENLQLSLSLLSVGDRADFISSFLSACAQHGSPLTAKMLLPHSEVPSQRIAYVRNAYTDEAYEVFSALLPDATLLSAENFREACEAVSEDDCGFCILPYENSGGVLRYFSELVSHYAFCITAFCRVFHTDGTDATRFALLARSPYLPVTEMQPRLRVSFSASDAIDLARHIATATMLGARVTAVESEPDTENKERLTCRVEFHLSQDGCLTRILTYLHIFAANFCLRGLYKEIDV